MPTLPRVLLAVLAVLIAQPAAASAAETVTCAYSAQTRTLSVTSTEDASAVMLKRSGSAIELYANSYFHVRSSSPRIFCTGPHATVTNTDTIAVGGRVHHVGLDLTGGPLAPGFSAEDDGSPEIEINAGAALRAFTLWGSSGREAIRAGMTAGVPRLNLNAAESTDDADVVAPGLDTLHVTGWPGDDVIDGRGGAGTGDPLRLRSFLAYGNSGDDSLGAAAATDSALLTGDDGDDTLAAGIGPGVDWLQPGDGNDRVTGLQAGGRDYLTWSGGRGGIRFDLTVTGPQDTGEGIDTVGAGLEAVGSTQWADVIRGTAGDDAFSGGKGNDLLDGRGGRDELRGGPGADTLVPGDGRDGGSDGGADYVDGGDGVDTLSYAGRTSSIAARFDGDHNDGADPNHDGWSSPSEEGDWMLHTERVLGGSGDDRFRAFGVGRVAFSGGDGDDWLYGGTGGDEIDGGPGTDTISYADRARPVAVRLDGLRNDGYDADGDGVSEPSEESDLLRGIENAVGGKAGDRLTAPGGEVNVLTGGPGADFLDAFDGSTAVDRLLCGTEADTYKADPSDLLSGCETPAP